MSLFYDKNKLEKLETTLKYNFTNKKLLQRAVTHKSFPNENPDLDIKNNERLEFLGDSVLNLAISTYLFCNFPEHPEGKLAKMKAILVSSTILAGISRKLNINEFIQLGKGEEMTGGRKRDSILADTMEAIIGSIYLDQNKNKSVVTKFIINNFREDIDAVVEGRHVKDYKTLLQENIQKNNRERPEYFVFDEQGPDHNKIFVVKVKLRDEVLGLGKGSSKKEAEQKAAKVALLNLGEL
jgi:ribonuclease-3